MNVRIRRADCCGHAECVQIAPDVFALKNHKAEVVDSDGASAEVLIEAAEACPCGAIEVEDDEGQAVA